MVGMKLPQILTIDKKYRLATTDWQARTSNNVSPRPDLVAQLPQLKCCSNRLAALEIKQFFAAHWNPESIYAHACLVVLTHSINESMAKGRIHRLDRIRATNSRDETD